MTDDAATLDAQEAENLDTNEAEAAPAKINQQVDVLDIGPCKKHIKVTIDRGDIDSRLDAKFSELVVKHRSHVRGFRPGKAPRKMIERLYKEEVYREVRGELLLGSLEQLAEEQDIAPLAPPNLEPGKIVIPDVGDMIYEFDVEVRPQFTLPEYRGLKLKRPTQTFTQADIDRERNRLLEPYGKLIEKENGIVETGDQIVVDINTKLGDRQLNDLKDVTLRVDPRLALRDGVAKKFAQEIGGAKVGDKRVVKIELSDAAADADLRGKVVDATFTVKGINRYEIPEIDDRILAEFNVRSVDALDELLRVVLERRLEYLQRQSARSQIISQVGDEAIKELPQDLLLRQARRALARKQMEMQNAGMTQEEIAGRSRILQADIIRNTALALKEHFVLQKIAEDEKLDIDDADIDAEIDRIASRNNESPRKVRARLEKEDLIESLAAELLETKALDLILDAAEFEDQPVDAEASDDSVATSEEQLVPGEVQDPLADADEDDAPGAEAK